jgi:acetyltransferase-like isoleucine patch superfamily enzyme
MRPHHKSIVESKYVGKGTRIWAFAHVMPKAKIGEDCNIGEGCFVESGSSIGNRVTLKNGVCVWKGVHIDNDVFIGPHTVFTNDLKPVSRKSFRVVRTRVRDGVCIGANATIICGRTIGKNAFVGAGSVVTRDIPDYALAFGNPVRLKGFLCSCRKELKFIKGSARCACGKKYRKRRGKNVSPV